MNLNKIIEEAITMTMQNHSFRGDDDFEKGVEFGIEYFVEEYYNQLQKENEELKQALIDIWEKGEEYFYTGPNDSNAYERYKEIKSLYKKLSQKEGE